MGVFSDLTKVKAKRSFSAAGRPDKSCIIPDRSCISRKIGAFGVFGQFLFTAVSDLWINVNHKKQTR